MTRGTGGVVLLRRPEEITVWDVYAALEPDEPQELLGIHPHPSALCRWAAGSSRCCRNRMGRFLTPCGIKWQQITLQDLLKRWNDQVQDFQPPEF